MTLLAVVGGWQIAILRLDAPGHPRTMIISSRTRIWKIFAAIRFAKLSAKAPEFLTILAE